MPAHPSDDTPRPRPASGRVRRPDGPVLVASARPPPVAVVANAERVVWSDGERVLGAPRPHGEASVLAVPESGPVSLIACDDGGVYFCVGATVWFAASAGGAARRIARARGQIGGLAADGGAVYWTEPRWGTVAGARADGGPPFVVAFGQCHPTAIAADPACVYWVNAGSGEVARAAREGGVVQVIASRQDDPIGLGLDEGHAYWLAGASIVRAPKRGGSPQRLAAIDGTPRDIAVGGGHAYASLDASPCVVRLPVGGGIATRWARWAGGPAIDIAADERALFVADPGTWDADGRYRGDGGILFFPP